MSDIMNKLILCFIPTNKCNLRCSYCFVSQTNEWERDDIQFRYPVEHIIKGLSKERLGGSCYINLTAQGETLLYKDIVSLTRGLLEEGHHVEIITNATITKKIDEILDFPDDLLENLFFKCSYHYEQMKGKPIEKVYWQNIDKIKKSPCSFTIELMPHDEIVGELDQICKDCTVHAGAVCHATVGRVDKNRNMPILTSQSQDEYVNTWSRLNSAMFNLKVKLFGVRRKEFCYAGKWSLLIDVASGEVSQCYGRINTQNIFEDLSKPIQFVPVGYSCMLPFCFNGHSHIAWGIIPELNSPTYYEVRNRDCEDGSSWVKKHSENYFKQKFINNHKTYSKSQKILHTIVNPFYLACKIFHDLHGVKRKLKKFYKIVCGKF